MPIIDGTKLACAACIRGHRSTSCNHTSRPLFEVRKKGRPMTQCNHCRDLRKVKQVHVRCHCRPDPSDAPKRPVTGKKNSNGESPLEETSCSCDDTGMCSCATPRNNAGKSDFNLDRRSRSHSTGPAVPSTSRPLRPEHQHQHRTSCCGRPISPSCCSGHDTPSSTAGTPVSNCCGNGVPAPSPASSADAGSCCHQPANTPASTSTAPSISANSTKPPVPLFSVSSSASAPSMGVSMNTTTNININMNTDTTPHYYLPGPSPFSPAEDYQPWSDGLTNTSKSARYAPYPQPYLPVRSLGPTQDPTSPLQPAYNSNPSTNFNQNPQNPAYVNPADSTNPSMNVGSSNGQSSIPHNQHPIDVLNRIFNSSQFNGSQALQSAMSSMLPRPPLLSSSSSPSTSTDTNTNANSTGANAKQCCCDPQSDCSCGTCYNTDSSSSSSQSPDIYDCAAILDVIQDLCKEMAKRPLVDLPYPIRKPQDQSQPQPQPQLQQQPQQQPLPQPRSRQQAQRQHQRHQPRTQAQTQRLEQLPFIPPPPLGPFNNSNHPLFMGAELGTSGDATMSTSTDAAGGMHFTDIFAGANTASVGGSMPTSEPPQLSQSFQPPSASSSIPISVSAPAATLASNSHSASEYIFDQLAPESRLSSTQAQTQTSSSPSSFSYLPPADEAILSQLEESLGLQPSIGNNVNMNIPPSTETGDAGEVIDNALSTYNCSCGPDCACIICSGNTDISLDPEGGNKPCSTCNSCANCVAIRQAVADVTLESHQFPSIFGV